MHKTRDCQNHDPRTITQSFHFRFHLVAAAQRPTSCERNESNPKLLKGWHHCLFGLAREQRVLALQRRDWLNCMSPANCLRARFRKTEVLHLAFLNQILHSARNIFDRNIQVDTMLIEEINGIDLETLERL